MRKLIDFKELSQAIQKVMPSFEIEYEIDLLRQNIADSWPYSLDDSAARIEWDWKPSYGLEQMIDDMFTNLGRRLNLE
jgi:nucleoside-diphosphate-sugar epimerase